MKAASEVQAELDKHKDLTEKEKVEKGLYNYKMPPPVVKARTAQELVAEKQFRALDEEEEEKVPVKPVDPTKNVPSNEAFLA